MSSAREAGEGISLIVETEAPAISGHPLVGGGSPTIQPRAGLRMIRLQVDSRTGIQGPQPGPLKILVAVGTPNEGKMRNIVLNMEPELHAILDAVKDARMVGNNYVLISNLGSLH